MTKADIINKIATSTGIPKKVYQMTVICSLGGGINE